MNINKADSHGTSEHIFNPPCWCLRTIENKFNVSNQISCGNGGVCVVGCDDMDNAAPFLHAGYEHGRRIRV